MINRFQNQMIKEELSQSRIHGVKIVIPVRSFFLNEALEPKLLKIFSIPEFLKQVYTEIDSMEISWSLSKRNQATLEIFQNDKWLKEKYLDNDYDWGVVHEYLSGFINITNSQHIFNTDFCKNQGYYYTLSNGDENPDDFFPFDVCWDLTACVKKEGDKILDNIWLVNTNANEIYDMKINIEEYLNLCYKAKGFHYWQLVYLFKTKSQYYELMKRFLPKMLPHINLDLSDFDIEL